MRRGTLSSIVGAGLLVGALALAGCGTQGYAAPLGKTSTTTLTGTYAGHATLTPTYATHVQVFYPSSTAVPNTGATTPAQLRQGSCTGPVIAPLDDTAPATDAAGRAPDAKNVIVRPDAAGGVDVSVQQDATLNVVVLATPNDPNAKLLACGNPLSGRRQFFDLYPPDVGSNGTGLGIVRIEPITATKVSLALDTPVSGPATWSVRSGGCGGAELASGTVAAGETSASGYVFSALTNSHWYVRITEGATYAPSCAEGSSGPCAAAPQDSCDRL